jgi:hypothetical protein
VLPGSEGVLGLPALGDGGGREPAGWCDGEAAAAADRVGVVAAILVALGVAPPPASWSDFDTSSVVEILRVSSESSVLSLANGVPPPPPPPPTSLPSPPSPPK